MDAVRAPNSTVVLDVTDVRFIDSAGLTLLVAARLNLLDQSARLELRNIPANMQHLLDLAGLSDYFTI